MGDKVEPRRKWIEENVAFTLEEDGSILDSNLANAAHDASNEDEWWKGCFEWRERRYKNSR